MAKFILIVLSLMLGSLIFTNCTRANLDTVYDPLKQTQHLKELKYRLSDYEWAVLNTYLQKNPKLSKQGNAQTYSQIMVLAEKAQAQEERMAQLALFKKQQRLKALYRGPVKAIKASDWPMLKGFYPDQHVKQIDWKLYSLVKGKDLRLKRFTPDVFKTCLNTQAGRKTAAKQSLYNLGLVCKTEFLKTWRPPMNRSAVIYIDFSNTKARKPTIVGSTNLPDGTQLNVSVSSLVTGYRSELNTLVKQGRYQAGPFVSGQRPLSAGTYLVKVTMPAASTQSEAVQEVIGANGEYLSGWLLDRNDPGISLKREVGMHLSEAGQAWLVAVPTPPPPVREAYVPTYDNSGDDSGDDTYEEETSEETEQEESDDSSDDNAEESSSLSWPSFKKSSRKSSSGRSHTSGSRRSGSSRSSSNSSSSSSSSIGKSSNSRRR